LAVTYFDIPSYEKFLRTNNISVRCFEKIDRKGFYDTPEDERVWIRTGNEII